MSKLTIEQYLMGRDKDDPIDDEQRTNALHLLSRINELLEQFYSEVPDALPRRITSGYRPASINAKVGGAKKSKHMLCAAIDLSDSDKKLGDWLKNQELLVKYDLYMEAKSATPNWVHLQLFPPRSKKRVFNP